MERIKIQEETDRQSSLASSQYDEQHYQTHARFRHKRHLGRGSSAKVAEVEESSTGEIYARKIFPFTPGSSQIDGIKERVENEVKNMKRLRHPHIAEVLFYLRSPQDFSIFMPGLRRRHHGVSYGGAVEAQVAGFAAQQQGRVGRGRGGGALVCARDAGQLSREHAGGFGCALKTSIRLLICPD